MAKMDPLKPDGMPLLSLGLGPSFPLHEGRLALTTALKYLFVAASILIGGFAGRRREEVASLREEPLFKLNGITYFTIYIEKSLRDVDGVPVPALVEKAVALLEELSAFARECHQTKWLFQFKADLADGQLLAVNTNFGNNLVEFVTFCGLEAPQGEPLWKLTYHMLRKGFVISSYHGNIWGSFDATNRSLRHKSSDQSRHYMDDEETGALSYLRNEVLRLARVEVENLSPHDQKYLADAKEALTGHDRRRRLWNEGRQEFFVSKMMEIYDGSERPIGRGAAALLGQLQDMEAKAYARIRIASIPTNGPADVRQDILKDLQTAAAHQFLEPVPGLPLYCTFKKGQIGQSHLANCLVRQEEDRSPWGKDTRVSSVAWPAYAFSGVFPCLRCSFCVLFNSNQQDVELTIEESKQAISKAATAGLAADAQAYVSNLVQLIIDAEEAVSGKSRS
jgi:hypothetical protein